ncbi:Spermidine/putrescine transport system permease protein PotB [bacterium HR31]|nr:Spermidine/putrescine transport system permease protein PotB [bacterium HR31]
MAPGWVSALRPVSRLRLLLSQPGLPSVLVSVGILTVLVVVPLLQLLATTVTWGEADTRIDPTIAPGTRTLLHWQLTLAGPLSGNAFWQPLQNSLLTSLGAAVLALALGTALAWLVARTDLPGSGWLRTLAVLPYIMPSWTIALAWLAAFRTEATGGGSLFHALTGTSPPDWVAYGAVPITVVLALHYFPFTFLLLVPALRSADASLEEAAEVAGAPRLMVWRRIILFLLLPHVLAAFVLTLSRTLGAFATPYLLGAPARFYTLATILYAHFTTGSPAQGSVVAVVLLAISAAAIYAGQRMLGARRGFVTVTGRGVRPRRVALGRCRLLVGVLAWGVVLTVVALPIALLLWESLMRYPEDYSLRNLTLHFWVGPSRPPLADGEPGILRNRTILAAAANSLKLALAVSVLTALAGFGLGLVVARRRGSWAGILVDQLAFLPYLIPSIAFGAIYLSAALRPWGPLPPLYGTFLLLVVVCVLKYLPYSVRATSAAFLQVSAELDEAAAVAGASLVTRVRRVLLPLLAPSLVAGALLAFVSAMRELSLIVLLATPSQRTLTMTTFRYTEQQLPQFADAIILLLVLVTVSGDLLGRWLESRTAPARGGRP